jgi:hypothetical protein
MDSDTEFVVETNLSPEQVSAVGVEIFKQWIEFAMGVRSLGGRMLKHPTGRYAAAISYAEVGAAKVSILANPRIDPVASLLETGHARFDLKTRFQKNRAYPMHRGSGGAPTLNARMWASARRNTSTGFASIGENSAADSWILPAMPAYSPARILAELAAKMGREGGIR